MNAGQHRFWFAVLGAAAALITIGCSNSNDAADPTPRDGSAPFREEDLASTTLDVGGYEVVIEGRRTTSETQVEITIPGGLRLITEPALVANGDKIGPHVIDMLPNAQLAHFPPTKVGEPIEIDPGTFVSEDDSEPITFTIAIGAALERSSLGADGHGKFAIDERDIATGPADRVISGERGDYSDREWVAVILEGNWYAEPEDRTVTDGDGEPLGVAHVQVGYTKDLQGNVGPGETNIAVFVESPGELGQLIIDPGPEAQVVEGVGIATLRPAGD